MSSSSLSGAGAFLERLPLPLPPPGPLLRLLIARALRASRSSRCRVQHSSSQWPTLLLHVGCVYLGRSLSVRTPSRDLSPLGDVPLKDLPLGPSELDPPQPEPPELEPALPDAARSEIAPYCWAIAVPFGTVVNDVALT